MDQEMSLKPITVKLSLIERLMGISTVAVAYIAVRCLSFETIAKILGRFKLRCQGEIGVESADIAWAAVRQSSFFFLGRAACLELSLAFFLFALIKGQAATLCVGVATEPFRSHSWIELSGKPFREPDYIEREFIKMFAV
jgi:Transglutaminase-like superfamily